MCRGTWSCEAVGKCPTGCTACRSHADEHDLHHLSTFFGRHSNILRSKPKPAAPPQTPRASPAGAVARQFLSPVPPRACDCRMVALELDHPRAYLSSAAEIATA